MATIGTPGSPTYSETLTGLEQMMDVLPDNTGNQISARNVRDVVFTLYDELIIGLSNSQLVSLTASNVYYFNDKPSVVTVGGLTMGATFSGMSVSNIFDRMLYPYVAPVINLVATPSILEYGNTQSVSIDWSITKKKNDLVLAYIYRPIESLYAVPSGSLPVTTHDTSIGNITGRPIVNTYTSFTFSVDDTDTSVSPISGGVNIFTASVSWQNRRYWGTHSSFTTPTLSSLSSELSVTRIQTRNGISGGGSYIVFGWPTTFGEPTFIVNGMVSNAWTKIGAAISHSNSYGYSESYDVWISNTIQNSTISQFQIN